MADKDMKADENMKIEKGIKGKKQIVVTREATAGDSISELPPVYATPKMVDLMETTCYESVAPYLEDDQTTVGVAVDIVHMAATPIGFTVTCESELVEVRGRKLVFDLVVYDDAEKVGKGRHERAIIDKGPFIGAVEAKAAAGRDGEKGEV